jgi:Xaa-Pro aminopeptidase
MQLAPAGHHLARHARVRETMRAATLDVLLVTALPNIAYLTGVFASAAALIISRDDLNLIVDGRYLGTAEARRSDLPGLRISLISATGSFDESIVDGLAPYAGLRAGFEEVHMTVAQHRSLVSRLRIGETMPELEPVQGLVEQLRMRKDDWELGRFRDAAARLSDAAKCILPKALAGMTERSVGALIDAELRRVGFDKPAFDTIVASGPNSAVPHHRAGDRRLEAGDLVVIDFGGMLDGYAVDLTRTITVGPPGPRERDLLEQVAAAQAAAFAASTVGRLATEVDEAARNVLTMAGLGEAFTHGTGHGLGLEVHERPRVGRRRAGVSGELLVAGTVFTLEPGAYLPGWGGVRIEDDVVVTPDGPEWLTDVPRLM